MPEIAKTMKLRLYTDNQVDDLFSALTDCIMVPRNWTRGLKKIVNMVS